MTRTANRTYQTTKHTNTTRTTKTITSTWVSPLTQSLCSYNRNNANSGVFIFKLRNKSTNFVHSIYHHQFVQFIDPEKPLRGLMNNFVHFIHPDMNSLPWNKYIFTYIFGNKTISSRILKLLLSLATSSIFSTPYVWETQFFKNFVIFTYF